MKTTKIGNYEISVEDGFNTEKEAIEFITTEYPELTKDEVKLFVKPLIKKQKDESNSSKKGNSESNSGNAKDN